MTAYLTRDERMTVVRALEVMEAGCSMNEHGFPSMPITPREPSEDQRRARRLLMEWNMGDTFGLVRQAMQYKGGESWAATLEAIERQDQATTKAHRRDATRQREHETYRAALAVDRRREQDRTRHTGTVLSTNTTP